MKCRKMQEKRVIDQNNGQKVTKFERISETTMRHPILVAKFNTYELLRGFHYFYVC